MNSRYWGVGGERVGVGEGWRTCHGFSSSCCGVGVDGSIGEREREHRQIMSRETAKFNLEVAHL